MHTRKRPLSVKVRGGLYLLLSMGWAVCGYSEEDSVSDIRAKIESLKCAAPLYSADGRTSVAGAALPAAEKVTVLRFVEEIRRRAGRLLGVSLNEPAHAIRVAAIDGEEGMVLLQTTVDASSVPPILIVVSSPELMTPGDFSAQACMALLRADALLHGYRDRESEIGQAGRFDPYPGWFGAGIARLIEPEIRQEDAETVFEQWCTARLPGVATLVDSFSPYASADPALAGQLVAWILDSPGRGLRFKELRDELTGGMEWNAGLVIEIAGARVEPGAADADWDAWLLNRRWSILTPGVTPQALIERTPAQLVVRPGNLGLWMACFDKFEPLKPVDLLEKRKEPWVPPAAVSQAALMQRLGAGRGDAYRSMTEQYTSYFLGLARGESLRTLKRRLGKAEAALQRLQTNHTVYELDGDLR